MKKIIIVTKTLNRWYRKTYFKYNKTSKDNFLFEIFILKFRCIGSEFNELRIKILKSTKFNFFL